MVTIRTGSGTQGNGWISQPSIWLIGAGAGLALVLLSLVLGASGTLRLTCLVLEMITVAAMCRLAALRADDLRVRAGWNWIALAMVVFGLTFLTAVPDGEVLNGPRSVADRSGVLLTVMAYACCVTGLAFALRMPRRMLARLFLDTAVMLGGATVIIVMMLQRSSIHVAEADLLNPMIYRPLVDLALLSLSMIALASLPRTARLYPALVDGTLAFTCLFVAHLGASVAALRGSETSPGWVYVVYAVGTFCVALAAYRYIRGGAAEHSAEPGGLVAHNPLTHSFWFHLGNAILPYTVAMMAATMLFIYALGDDSAGRRASLALAGSLAFVVAGGLRHAISHIETRDLYVDMTRLNLELEDLIEQRTSELVQRNEELEALQEVALVSAMTLDLTTILRSVSQQLALALGASYCAIYEHTADGDRIAARYDKDDLYQTSRLRPVESSLVKLPRSAFDPVGHRSSVINRWEQIDGSAAATALDERAAGAALLVPLVAGEHTIGVAEIFRPGFIPFSAAEISLAEAIATHAALATENARVYDKTRFAANHDPITGLLNHRALHEELAVQLERATQLGAPLTVLMMDLNLFKEFNDRFGHQAGDEVLADIGQAIRHSVPTSAIVARYGGDEFTVGIPGSPREHAPMFIAAIRERVDRIQDRHGFVGEGFGVSVGVASYPEDGLTLSELISKADQAMYQDKWRLKGFVDRRRSSTPQAGNRTLPHSLPQAGISDSLDVDLDPA